MGFSLLRTSLIKVLSWLKERNTYKVFQICQFKIFMGAFVATVSWGRCYKPTSICFMAKLLPWSSLLVFFCSEYNVLCVYILMYVLCLSLHCVCTYYYVYSYVLYSRTLCQYTVYFNSSPQVLQVIFSSVLLLCHVVSLMGRMMSSYSGVLTTLVVLISAIL